MPDFLANAKLNQVSPAGNIAPMQFICADQNWSFTCRTPTAAADLPLGISQVGANITPNLFNTLSSGLYNPANVAGYGANNDGSGGQQIAIFTSGDVAPIRISGGATGTAPGHPTGPIPPAGTYVIGPGTLIGPDLANPTLWPGQAVAITAFAASTYMGGVALQFGNPGDIIECYVLPGRA